MSDNGERLSDTAEKERDGNYAEKQKREQNMAITDQTLMCRSCAPPAPLAPLIDFQRSAGIRL